MNRSHLYKLLLVIFITAWSIYELWPPTSRDLLDEFVAQAKVPSGDTNFAAIVATARSMNATNPERAYENLLDAIGNRIITNYFPQVNVSRERYATNYNRLVLNHVQRAASGKIKLGLDLQGGTSFTITLNRDLVSDFQRLAQFKSDDLVFSNIIAQARQLNNANPTAGLDNLRKAIGTNVITNYFPMVDLSKVPPSRYTETILEYFERDRASRVQDREYARRQAIEVLRKRVDKFGVAEPIIQPAGEDRIIIQIPGLSQAAKESARRQIERAAFLEFRIVHPQSSEYLEQGITPPGYEVLVQRSRGQDGRDVDVRYLVNKKPERGMTGKYVAKAWVGRHEITNEPEILFQLTAEGAAIFAEITREHTGHLLAIVLDGVLYSAPRINEPITGGSGRITGNFDVNEAIEIAQVLENPLETPVQIVQSSEVDPALGKDSVRSGAQAVIIGTAAVVVFMLVYYLVAGVVANVALVLNIIILLGVMCSFGTTLTMPGIAGIVLTIGMAVDANVLIYERMREEYAAGKSIRGAVAAGYEKAFGTILDSNVTTLIASVILIWLGTGPVKGFGVALTIGVSVSMFTALIVTRLIFDYLLARGWLTSIKMLHLIRDTKLDFMKLAKPAFVMSWTIILIGLSYGIFVRGHGVLGIDFAGGDRMTIAFAQRVEVDALRKTIEALRVGEVQIQYQRDISVNKEHLQVVTPYNKGDTVIEALNKAFPTAKFNVIGRDTVGPSVGKEIQKTALYAVAIAMIGILLYVALRYEFSFAVGAVTALVHDILITLGIFFLSGRELNAPIVAAVLTIIGFSINDTIVIFDRIREDLKLGVRGTFKELINTALNQTLSRTIITSGTVFLSTAALFIFGGGAVNDFAFCFLVGIITGTYSSIYIASALVLWWHKGQRPVIGAPVAAGQTPSTEQVPQQKAAARA